MATENKWVLKDDSGNHLGLLQMWWSAEVGTPWHREVEVWRASLVLPDLFYLEDVDNGFVPIRGRTTAQRQSAAAKNWASHSADKGIDTSGITPLVWIGKLTEIPGFVIGD